MIYIVLIGGPEDGRVIKLKRYAYWIRLPGPSELKIEYPLDFTDMSLAAPAETIPNLKMLLYERGLGFIKGKAVYNYKGKA